MELKEAIEKRKSVRYYEDKPIPEDKLLMVPEVVRLAPSGGNSQPRKFIVVRGSKRQQKLWLLGR
jgi:nitroreductase